MIPLLVPFPDFEKLRKILKFRLRSVTVSRLRKERMLFISWKNSPPTFLVSTKWKKSRISTSRNFYGPLFSALKFFTFTSIHIVSLQPWGKAWCSQKKKNFPVKWWHYSFCEWSQFSFLFFIFFFYFFFFSKKFLLFFIIFLSGLWTS